MLKKGAVKLSVRAINILITICYIGEGCGISARRELSGTKWEVQAVGMDEEAIKKYVENQMSEDIRLDKMDR